MNPINPILLAIIAFAYILGLPIILRLLCLAHTKVFINRKLAKLPRNQQGKVDVGRPLWPRIKERVLYTFKDSRPFQFNNKGEPKEEGLTNKQVLIIIWCLGLIVFLTATIIGTYWLLCLGFLFFSFAVGFGIQAAHPIIKGREQIYTKMHDIGKSTLGMSSEQGTRPQSVIQILEWREPLSPTKVRFQIPTTFNADSSESFLRQFNQVFGTDTTWVAFDDPESRKPGWNFAEGELTLKETPPLPQMAPWSEHYVLDPGVAWSFFPVALGVEDGIEIMNPATGKMENVLGFDLSGEQVGLSKKMGAYCSPKITTSPMVLAAGGTGGGKALSVKTKVRVKKPDYIEDLNRVQ